MAKIKIEDLPILESLSDEEIKGITGGSERPWERQVRLDTEEEHQAAGMRRLQDRGLSTSGTPNVRKDTTRKKRRIQRT